MRRLRIGIDMDGVLADFEVGFREVCRELFGFPLKDIRPKDWNWSNYNLSGQQIGEIWVKIRHTTNFWQNLKPLPSTSFLSEADSQHDLYFVTSRVPTEGLSPTLQSALWLRDNYGLPNPTVLVSEDKGLIATALKLDAFVDDKPSNCLSVKHATKESGRCCDVYLNMQHHNLNFHAESWGLRQSGSFNHFFANLLEKRIGAATPALVGA